MAEIMKTKANPPSRLTKKLISLSEADDWEEASKEWVMRGYYCVLGYCSCLCSPRGVHNITVIENIHNFNQMYICNPCADLYFGIQESLKIEATVRRLKKNKDLNMDDICLAYLFRNKFIDRLELKNYRLVRLSRKDEYSRFYRQRINKRIINFTDYANKPIFEKIEILIAWSKKMENPHYISVFVKQRKELAETGQIDVAYLDAFIEKNEIELSSFTKQDRDLALEAIGEQRQSTLDLEEYVRTTKLRLTNESDQYVLSGFCFEGLEDNDTYDVDRQEETEECRAIRKLIKVARDISLDYSIELQDSQDDFQDQQQEQIYELFRIGRAQQEVEEKRRADEKERKEQRLKDKKTMQEERKVSKLNQGNFDFIYPHGCDTLKWDHFHESVISPIDKDVLDDLSYLIYTWFLDIKKSRSLKSFIYFFTNREIAHKFKLIPYSREFVEIMYVGALLQLIDIDELGGILNDLYKSTDDNIKSDKVELLNEILSKKSYVATLKDNVEILITKK